MAIDKLIVSKKFNGSKSFNDKRIDIRNTGKVNETANLVTKNNLKRSKKKQPIKTHIIIIRKGFDGGKKKAKEAITARISNKNTNFFPNLPVASAIGINYNR